MFDVKIFFRNKIIMILVIIGIFVFSTLSFYDILYNTNWIISNKDKPNIFFLVVAIIFMFCFIINFLPINKIINKERRQYKYEIIIDENHRIIVSQGDISSYKGDTDKVILLPANTSFDEKCITDKNSALGCYFLKNYADRINETKKIIIDTATKNFSLSTEKKCADLGATILLPKYDGNKINILISAVTQDNPGIGIQANATGIMASIKNALTLCSQNRYSSVTMPIIGTGHGGLKPDISLMLICIQYFISLNHLQNHVTVKTSASTTKQKSRINYHQIIFLEEEDEVQQRGENDVAGGLEAKRQECQCLCKRKRFSSMDI